MSKKPFISISEYVEGDVCFGRFSNCVDWTEYWCGPSKKKKNQEKLGFEQNTVLGKRRGGFRILSYYSLVLEILKRYTNGKKERRNAATGPHG